MKIVFLLDNNEYVEVSPEKLQIRQVAVGQSAVGIEVTVPARNEDGVIVTNEDGSPKMQTGFRPFVNYAVDLSVPVPTEVSTVEPAPVAEEAAIAPQGKSKAKAKRRAN